MASNLLISNSSRTELSNVELESTELQGSNSNRVESSQTIELFKQMVSKMTGLADFFVHFFSRKSFPPKKTEYFWINSKFGNFCLNFKFANFLSNFELLRTSILRYKNSNFRTRTKFEAISTMITTIPKILSVVRLALTNNKNIFSHARKKTTRTSHNNKLGKY